MRQRMEHVKQALMEMREHCFGEWRKRATRLDGSLIALSRICLQLTSINTTWQAKPYSPGRGWPGNAHAADNRPAIELF